jgi:glycosyltransferase involved in cell wall biosynthesis
MTRPNPAKRYIVIVINALHSGGAEKSCIELARFMNAGYELEVIALLDGGPAAEELRAAGVKVTLLQATGPWRQLVSCWRLAKLFRTRRPDVVITFLYLADLVGGALARMLVPDVKVYWNIRNNLLARNQVGTISYAASRLNARLSRVVPSVVVYCSPVARAQHESIGYRGTQSPVVENTPASVPFVFSAERRAAFRRARFDGDFVFLFVGRFDPVKRVDVFIDACARVHRHTAGAARFAIAGRAMDLENPWLKQVIEASGIAERFALLGHVSDQQLMYSGADCLIVTSETEGSPNAVYEAMATQLQTIILATVGTENIKGPGVRRLASRSVEDLVQAMVAVVARGIPAAESRQTAEGARSAAMEHPLVSYYRTVLPCP